VRRPQRSHWLTSKYFNRPLFVEPGFDEPAVQRRWAGTTFAVRVEWGRLGL
jgi:hypothetical protein